MGQPGPVRIGALGPLSSPGLVWAGRELFDGMRLAIERVNGERPDARLVAVTFSDTRGTPEAGVSAAGELLREGAAALIGEYHSVVAEAIARHADSIEVPFLCSSATLDAITARRSPWVFRLAPPQSYGWRLYADFLQGGGYQEVVAIIRSDLYWGSGARVLERRLEELRIPFRRLEMEGSVPKAVDEVAAMLAPGRRLMVLLLAGYPQPTGSLVRELQRRGLFPDRLGLGAPAGPCIFPDWWAVAGDWAIGIPFLSYVDPGSLSPDGEGFARAFADRYGREPSFVAFEGYDTVLAVGQAVATAPNRGGAAIRDRLQAGVVQGTRGAIRFLTEPEGVVHQQWRWPPVRVVAYRRPHGPPSTAEVLWPAP